MLEAVQAVHDQNVVHTDLKPANFVLVKGKLKIIDFGIAKAIANDTVNIHRDTQVRLDALSARVTPDLILGHFYRSVRSTTCRLKPS